MENVVGHEKLKMKPKIDENSFDDPNGIHVQQILKKPKVNGNDTMEGKNGCFHKMLELMYAIGRVPMYIFTLKI